MPPDWTPDVPRDEDSWEDEGGAIPDPLRIEAPWLDETCPHCGRELEQSENSEDVLTCPTHGPITMKEGR